MTARTLISEARAQHERIPRIHAALAAEEDHDDYESRCSIENDETGECIVDACDDWFGAWIIDARTREPQLCTLLEKALDVIHHTKEWVSWPETESVPIRVIDALEAFDAAERESAP